MTNIRSVVGITTAIWLAFSLGSRGNDSSIAFRGGHPQLQNETQVTMVAEKLNFHYVAPITQLPPNRKACDPEADNDKSGCLPGWECDTEKKCYIGQRWQADLTYTFKNNGPPKTLIIGLPFDLPPIESESDDRGPTIGDDIEGFLTWVDGQSIPVKRYDIPEEERAEDSPFNRLYTVPVPFQAGQTRILRHRYLSHEWSGIGGKQYNYLLKTGNHWSGPIGQVEIDFELPPNLGPCALANLPWQRQGNHIKIALKHWKPDRDLRIFFAERERALMGSPLNPQWEFPLPKNCGEALLLSPEERRQLAEHVELLYGAPHENKYRHALKTGPFELCKNIDWIAMLINSNDYFGPNVGLTGFAYIPDKTYPHNMPTGLRQCLKQMRP